MAVQAGEVLSVFLMEIRMAATSRDSRLDRVKIAFAFAEKELLLIFAPCQRHIGPVRCRLYKTLLPWMKCFYWPFQHILTIQNLAGFKYIDLEAIDCDL